MEETAIQKTNAAAIEQAKQTQLAVNPAVMLDRENLQFFANMIEAANLIPKGADPLQVRKSRVMAKICAGVAHGFDPISAQQNLDIIDGKIGLNARGLETKLSRTNIATRVEYLTDKGCKLSVLEKNDAGKWIVIGDVEFNEDNAKAAGLLGKAGDMYKKYGPDMYFARCITRVCKRFAPETLDTATVGYNLAKRQETPAEETQAPTPHQIAENAVETPTQATPAASVGEEYAETEYSGPADEFETVTIEEDHVDAAILEQPDDADEPEPDEIPDVEKLRGNVIAQLEEFPLGRRKDLIAGKTPISKMDEAELLEFTKFLNEQA